MRRSNFLNTSDESRTPQILWFRKRVFILQKEEKRCTTKDGDYFGFGELIRVSVYLETKTQQKIIWKFRMRTRVQIDDTDGFRMSTFFCLKIILSSSYIFTTMHLSSAVLRSRGWECRFYLSIFMRIVKNKNASISHFRFEMREFTKLGQSHIAHN